jgi:hypothetical protein
MPANSDRPTAEPTPHVVREVAVEACTDPRSVRTRIRNLSLPEEQRTPQRSTTIVRIDRALRARGCFPSEGPEAA